jgi:hypothetical protein
METVARDVHLLRLLPGFQQLQNANAFPDVVSADLLRRSGREKLFQSAMPKTSDQFIKCKLFGLQSQSRFRVLIRRNPVTQSSPNQINDLDLVRAFPMVELCRKPVATAVRVSGPFHHAFPPAALPEVLKVAAEFAGSFHVAA